MKRVKWGRYPMDTSRSSTKDIEATSQIATKDRFNFKGVLSTLLN